MSADYIRTLLAMDMDDAHVRKCWACRWNHERAVAVATVAHGNLDVAAILWRAREILSRETRYVSLLRRDLDRKSGRS